MRAEQIEKLEQLARDYIDGKIVRGEINSLGLFPRWYVLTLANIYSCTKIGTMSQKECVRFKYQVAVDYKRFAVEAAYAEMNYRLWLENTKKYSGKSCEVTRELNKEQPDAYSFISGLCELLDLMTHENVLLKMFQKKYEDEGFKKACHLAVVEHGDEWRERYRNIHDEDYLVLLDKFFAATNENGMAEQFASLNDDTIRKTARRVPVKDDDSRGVARSFRELYDNKRV